ncbi:DUF106 domain-containing protein [Methanosalsum natronophilum]|uniref:DUF106 domain-containing protein n=1 Tax=Methanosalsum natronophilum TaxID=768733 RepID=A0A3R7VWH7_9EURY|nr:EMC3/TMCO1 family protein [Methanosalsum natronophilum]MCS3924765.1 uncharacterized membrane protein (DUF106 family) [Methanosalsum natronophilum]RQD82153.1 MAG: DUF106 domain-containing protein [Methanosalsum natronophilum]
MKNFDYKSFLDRLVIALGVGLLFGLLLFGEDFRESFGGIFEIFMDPILGAIGGEQNFHIALLILAAITALYASLIQKYTIDWSKMRLTQEKMKAFQKEFREAQLSQNSQQLKKMEQQRSEMMSEQLQMSKQQIKPMLYISVISLPLFLWAYFYIITHPDISMVFPFIGERNLADGIIGPIQYWIFWYFITSLGVSQLIRKSLDIGGL